jgi:flagellar hook protein FlgE
MTFVNLFAPSTAALRSSAAAFQVIGDNIANSVTPGYKAADTRFSEVLSSTPSQIFDSYGGNRPIVQNFIDKQGILEQTQRPFDIALNGRGFLVSNTAVDGSGTYQLGRAGQLIGTAVQNGSTTETYLTDSTGSFILGWAADANGNFTTGTTVDSLEAIRIDPDFFGFDPVATTAGTFNAILPAAEPAGTVRTGSMPVIDADGVEHALILQFTKSATPNTWDMVASATDGTVTAGGTATLTFDATGALVSPTSQPISLTYAGTGGASTVALDLSGTRELGTAFTIVGFSQNGLAAGEINSFSFDEDGVLSGLFSNGQTRALYKLPVGVVNSPNLLEPIDGTHFALTEASGDLTLLDAATSNVASFVPGALEQSTTDLSSEFSKMILTQQSYSTNVRAFTVAEEMTRVAYELKA